MKIMKKKAAILFLALTVASTVLYFASSLAAPTPFSDVPDGHWAASAIAAANASGIMTGTGNGRFSPDGTVSMAQFVTILTRMYWPDEIAVNESTGTWYAKNVGVGINHGLFKVLYTPGVQEEYDYEDPITRAMMAQLVCNAMLANGEADVTDIQSVISQIPDVSVNHQFAQGIAFCYSRGILQGVDKNGSFNPEGTLTRAQTAAICTRISGETSQSAQAAETPVTETPTTAAQDLNEWGIPHFRMLPGENVQQMMDRINAATPAYREGYLTNGKPISEANIREMADAILRDMPKGEPWGTGPTYYYTSACGYYGACGAYACAVSDYIFGEDAPVMKHTHFESTKAGDVQARIPLDDDGHIVFAINNPDANATEIYTSDDGINFTPKLIRMFKAIDGNVDGKVGGISEKGVLSNDNTKWAQNSFIISRY